MVIDFVSTNHQVFPWLQPFISFRGQDPGNFKRHLYISSSSFKKPGVPNFSDAQLTQFLPPRRAMELPMELPELRLFVRDVVVKVREKNMLRDHNLFYREKPGWNRDACNI